MDMYFLLLTIIDLFVLTFMCILIVQSNILSTSQRKSFICADIMIALISIIEIITVLVEGLPPQFRVLNIIFNFLGFGLTPAVPICLAYCISESRDFIKAITLEAVYLIFLAISLPFGVVFSVDADNGYSRGNGFFVYLIVCLLVILYLVHATLRLMQRFQNKGRLLILIMIGILLFGGAVQVLYPELHLTWLSVTLLLLLYYMYCCDIWQQVDGLTGLLNQKSYIIRTSKLKERSMLIVFDVDSFKEVNDRYGHLAGDECLKAIADCIRRAYANYGLCYRIGGDEFCVLLKAINREEKCRRTFCRILDLRRTSYKILPTVSYGSAMFEIGDSVESVKALADKNMYNFKQESKMKKSNYSE